MQIATYFGGIVRGNWGHPIHTHQPVLSDLVDRAPASLELVIAALIIALLLGIPLGLVSARWPGRSCPTRSCGSPPCWRCRCRSFWLALILQLVFSQRLHLLPVAGQYDPEPRFTHPLMQYTRMPVVDALITGNWPMFGSTLSHLVLPALVVAAYPVGVITRMVRAPVLDTLGEAHVQMVRALGFPERAVFGRFAMKLAWNPVAAVLALVFAYSLVNTFLVESIFDWPGLGSYAAAPRRPWTRPAIVGVTLFVAIVYVVANLVVDIVQAAIDPRIRLT